MKVSPVSRDAVVERTILRQATFHLVLKRVVAGVKDPWLWASVVAILVVVGISCALTIQPIDRDEGAFAVIAHGILQGKLPYRDFFDQEGPAIYYLLAGILFIAHGFNPFGQAELMRLSVDITNSITAIGLVILGKKLWRIEVGVLGAALWLISLPYYEGNWFVTEPYMVTFSVLSAAVAAYDGTRVSREHIPGSLHTFRPPLVLRGLVAGILLAISSMFKQTAVLELPGIVILLSAQPGGWWQRVAAWASFAVGFCASWLLVCVAFASQGALQPLLNDVIWSNLTHYPGPGRDALILEAKMYVDQLPVVWIFPLFLIIAVCAYAVWHKRLPGHAIIALYVLAALGWVPLFAHDYPHYWLQPLPWVCLLTSAGVFWIIGNLREKDQTAAINIRRSVAIGVLLGLVIGLSATQNLVTSRIPIAQEGIADQMSLAQWINHNVPVDKSLLIGPANPEYYFLSGRMPETHYVYLLTVDSSLYPESASEVQLGEFQYVIWNTGYGGAGSEYEIIYNAILARYRPISSFPANGFVLYILKS